MRSKTVAIAVGVTALLAIAIVATRGDRGTNDGAATPTLAPATSALPAAEKETAELLADRIAAVAGFAETCGDEAYEIGVDVFDGPQRLVDAVGIEALACRDQVLTGMLAAAQGDTFTEEQIDTVTQGCTSARPDRPSAQTCGVLIGTIAATSDPVSALVWCNTLSSTRGDFEPSQQVICATSYLSLATDDGDPAGIPDRALARCAEQLPATRTLCAASLGGLLLAIRDVRPPKITTVKDTITKLTTLVPAVERCRALEDLSDTCQTGIVDAMVVRYPMGSPSSVQRDELCSVFDGPTRKYCVTRSSPPDAEFREEPGNEELAPQD